MNELFSVKDKVVVIISGTGVLGACISAYLAKEGAKVVILGRRKDEGEKIVNEIIEAGGEAMFLSTDVLNAEMLQQNCDEIMAKYGRIDALLNAAGGNMPGATIPPATHSLTSTLRLSRKYSTSTSPEQCYPRRFSCARW